jgi:hypothetical protein
MRSGIPATQESRYQIIDVGSKEYDLTSKERALEGLRKGIPGKIEIRRGSELNIVANTPIKSDNIINKMVRYRLIIFLGSIYELSEI